MNAPAPRLQGRKDLLGIYIGDAESARFWLSTLTDLQNRGVKDLLICSIDNLSGFGDAIETVFPQADVQLCLVHQVRTSLRYVVSKDQKAVVADLKPIYQSATLAGAEQKLIDFADTWGAKYPLVVESWKRNWLRLTRFFDYPAAIRKVVYTTAPAARQYSGGFSSPDSLCEQIESRAAGAGPFHRKRPCLNYSI